MVRARAIRSLSSANDPALATVYLQALNDQSYAVIAEAARALGPTKNSEAYPALVKLVDAESWHDTVKASALTGLALLGDKRALELGFKFVAVGNRPAVRAAALALLAVVGKDDPRTFPVASEMLKSALEKESFTNVSAAMEALVGLRDRARDRSAGELRERSNGEFTIKGLVNAGGSAIKSHFGQHTFSRPTKLGFLPVLSWYAAFGRTEKSDRVPRLLALQDLKSAIFFQWFTLCP